MKPLLYCAIVTSVLFASLTVPALQARADETAWELGRAAGQKCVTDGPEKCKFENPYPYKADDPDATTTARNNSDYIAGFIVGKSEATK